MSAASARRRQRKTASARGHSASAQISPKRLERARSNPGCSIGVGPLPPVFGERPALQPLRERRALRRLVAAKKVAVPRLDSRHHRRLVLESRSIAKGSAGRWRRASSCRR